MNKLGNLTSSAKLVLWRIVSIVTTLVLIAVLGVAPALAKATTDTANFIEPIDLFVFVPCARGGAGEFVQLSGTLHVLFHTTLDNKGGFHSKYHFQAQGITGKGEITGDKYQGTGVTQGTFNGKVGFEATDVNNFKIIGQGPGNNFLVHSTFHVTVNPKGEVTAFVDNFSVKCKSASYP